LDLAYPAEIPRNGGIFFKLCWAKSHPALIRIKAWYLQDELFITNIPMIDPEWAEGGAMERHLLDIIHDQRPLMLAASATVKDACCEMRSRNVGATLVTDVDGRLVGIFTGRDAVGRVLAEGKSAARTLLADVMTANPTTIGPGRTAIEALRLMQDSGVRHLPVTEKDRVVGIVSRGDFRGLEHARLDHETGLWERI
jgi:CBS domain-containing protein